MSRIRSVHPGLWTDERFVSVSALARLLFIGIWNECDDQGSFEWSPIKLKMRLLPADNADASELLAELASAGCLMNYEAEGRQLGAVRNFAAYQRPKKPNSIYPQTDEVRNYCGHKGEPVPNQLPTGGEKSPQMEDGGGKGSSVSKETALDSDKDFWDAAKGYLGTGKASLIGKWCGIHGQPATAQAITAAMLKRPPDPVSYIQGIFRTQKAEAESVPVC